MTASYDGFRTDADRMSREAASFVEEAIADAGAEGVVLGLGGGLPSAVVAHVATRAVGPSAVLGYAMPAAPTSHGRVQDARAVADDLGILFDVLDVQPLVDDLLETAGPSLDDPAAADRVATNAAARLRMALLYAEANARARLVLGTVTRSELLLGCFTKYGDGGGDLRPIGHLYSTEVRTVAQDVGLEDPATRRGLTGLLQTDAGPAEDERSVDAAIDEVLHRQVDRQQSVDVVADAVALDRDVIEEIVATVAANRHKRRVPPDPRTYGAEFVSTGDRGDGDRSGGALSDVHMQHIVDLLSRPPSVVGFEAREWTPELVQRYVADAYGTDYPVERIRRLMDELGY